MSLENSKRLYLHYKKSNNLKAAANMLKKYPKFEAKEAEVIKAKE